jgi:hypothetical protein
MPVLLQRPRQLLLAIGSRSVTQWLSLPTESLSVFILLVALTPGLLDATAGQKLHPEACPDMCSNSDVRPEPSAPEGQENPLQVNPDTPFPDAPGHDQAFWKDQRESHIKLRKVAMQEAKEMPDPEKDRSYGPLDLPTLPNCQLIRTWPAEPPIGRRYVIDGIKRIYMSNYNYVPVFEKLTTDVLIVEWDIAFSPEALEQMSMYISVEPDRIHVAPFKLYPISTALANWVYCHRHIDPLWWINRFDPYCQMFGLGMTYLPLDIVKQYLATKPEGCDDTVFSRWHYENVRHDVPVHWSAEPYLLHLHY